MGYYSDVGIKCGEEAYKKLSGACLQSGLAPSKLFKNSNDERLLIWEGIKWYDDLPDISAINEVLYDLNQYDGDEKPEYGYKFIRLGECDDDNEVRSNASYIEFYFVRSFDTSGMELLNEIV